MRCRCRDWQTCDVQPGGQGVGRRFSAGLELKRFRGSGLVVVQVGVQALPAGAFAGDGFDRAGLGVAAE